VYRAESVERADRYRGSSGVVCGLVLLRVSWLLPAVTAERPEHEQAIGHHAWNAGLGMKFALSAFEDLFYFSSKRAIC